ncbi:hypothetical protein [Agromyces aerolatus]|uniref:hypothetical protein n=1 Tax=Agromyces sp. LY-1074 TaxID=3074080 RepID=UPI0028625AF5|nr:MULTISPECIES: hypothetical protein [unclassified Agromyces]MDR5699101.1 hypothetical protein [Agromyces sp. LY-1074]MDR5705120.1 hypothetical protein [Agromyces sp. LY-1358]
MTGHAPPGPTGPIDGPIDVGVGHALITLVSPRTGHERAYNRWYEDDHFWAGGLYCPWIFAGRRWTATRELTALRSPERTPVTDDVRDGSYLTTYWIAPGRLQETTDWLAGMNARLGEAGRIFAERDHVYTSFTDHAGTVYRDAAVPRDVFSLMDPAPGLVLGLVDAPSAEARPGLERWLLDDHLPGSLARMGHASSAMVFRTNPPDPRLRPDVLAGLARVAGNGGRLTVLWFLDEEPSANWDGRFGGLGDELAAGGGELTLLAPFIPSVMGTDTYADVIRPQGG